MERLHLNVNGMTNTQNKTALKNALDKIDGVTMINVDLANGSVEVGYGEPATEDQIKSCVEDTGMSVE